MRQRLVDHPFPEHRVIHEDDDLLVVDKPAFVPSQASEEGATDDLVSRLRAMLVRRGEASPYLGVHQRLDRDTSGVILFTRRKSANPAIARQFEGRGVEKRYLAAVTGREVPKIMKDLVVARQGRAEVVGRAQRGAQEAITRARVVERRSDRALVELSLETGRMHQARVQLAHHGAPIAGDPIYGGAPAPRLMLHAESLALTHPGTGARTTFRAPPPPELVGFVESGDLGDRVLSDPDALARTLASAVESRYGLATSEATTAFRLVNEAGDGIPGVAIDVYGDHAVVQLYGEGGPFAEPGVREGLLDAVHALGFDGVPTMDRR